MEDYCTLSPDWGHGSCCRQHDIAYTFQTGKYSADVKLAKCVTSKSGAGWGILAFSLTSTIGWLWYWKAGFEAGKFK